MMRGEVMGGFCFNNDVKNVICGVNVRIDVVCVQSGAGGSR